MTGSASPAQRIVVLVKRFPRLSETFIMNEFLELQRRGLPVALYAIMDPHEPRAHPEAAALVPGVTYLQTGHLWQGAPAVLRTVRRHPLGMLRAGLWTITRHTRAAVRNLIHAAVLVDRLAGDGPAHVHAHFLHSPAAIAFIAKKISGQRYSLSGHAKDIYTTLPENLVMRCREAEFVTTCTDANRRHLAQEVGLPPSSVHLCRHGVDVERFSALRPSPVPGRIVSVGRLVAKKGHDVLVLACAELARRGIEFELRIIGSGPLRDELRELAADQGVADRVDLAGGMSQGEVIRELADAELFALSPRIMADGDRDGIPNVLMEAMAAGVPVVASAVSGIPELLSDGVNARLVEPERPSPLADVLGDLLTDRGQRERLRRAGQRFARDECAWGHAIAPLESLLRGMLESSNAPVPELEQASSAMS